MKANVKEYYLVVKVMNEKNIGIYTVNYLLDDIMKVIDYCKIAKERDDVVCCEWSVLCKTSSKITQKTLDEKVKHDELFLYPLF